MSLGDYTKCDLSFDKADIDYEELVKTLKEYYRTLCNIMVDDINSMKEDTIIANSLFPPRILKYRVDSFARTAELLYTIEQMKDRSEINFIKD